MLTGPGGAFESHPRHRPRRGDEGLQGPHAVVAGDLPDGGERGDGDDATHIVYGDRRIGFAEFTEGANRVARRWRPGTASAAAIASPCCRPTTPSGCPRSGRRSTSARSSSASTVGGRPTRSFTASRTPAPRSSWPTVAVTTASPIRSTGSASRRSTSSRTTSPNCSTGRLRRTARRADRGGRPRRHLLHERYDRAGPRARSRRTGR